MIDFGFIPFVKNPLLDSFGTDQASLAQDLQMFACGRLADTQLASDQHPAHAVLYHIAVNLWREVLDWILEPI